MAQTRIVFLNVPIDIVQEEEFSDKIMEISKKKEFSQICFVSIWDVLKARRNQEYLSCLKNASLVIPISKSILRGAEFLKLTTPVRYNPFKTVINIMNVIDKNFGSLYLLGGRKESLMNTTKNISSTFPGIHIVGRFVGYYPKSIEPNMMEAIHKASPALFLSSDGVTGGDLWSFRRKDQMNPGIFLYYKDCFGIFSKRKRRISYFTFDKGLEIWSEMLHNPFKIFLILPYMWYLIVLTWYKISKKGQKQALDFGKENKTEK